MLNVQNCGHARLRRFPESEQSEVENRELSALDLLFIGASQIASYYKDFSVYSESEEHNKLFEVTEKLLHCGVRFTRWFHMGFDLIARGELQEDTYELDEGNEPTISSHEVLIGFLSRMLEMHYWQEDFTQSDLIIFLSVLMDAGTATILHSIRSLILTLKARAAKVSCVRLSIWCTSDHLNLVFRAFT